MIQTLVAALAHRPELASLHHLLSLQRDGSVLILALVHFKVHRVVCRRRTEKLRSTCFRNTVEAVPGYCAPSSAESRPCSRCRTLTLGSLLRWAGASVTLVGGLTSSSSISPSAKFPSGLGTPSSVTMNLGLAESPRSLLTLQNKQKSGK